MKHIIPLFFAVLLTAGCSKGKSNDFDRFIVEKTVYPVDYEGGSASIAVNSNTSWRVVPEQDYNWFTINKLSGKGTDDILLEFLRNEGNERSATLTIAASGYDPVIINIIQEALKSDMRLGDPYIETKPFKDDAGFCVKVPYYNAIGTENVLFTLSFSGVGSAGLETQTYSCAGFSVGDGVASIPVTGVPTALGALTITLEAFGEKLEPCVTRVLEKMTYLKYISWNNWANGYTRSDFNTLRGSAFDYSWTSEAVHKTESGAGTDHKALYTSTTLPGCEDAYLSLVCANPIVAAGQASGPTGTPGGLAGYQFNPGYQVQGMVKDDYVFVYIPKVSIPAGGKITFESSLGGATGAACAFIVEYSADNSSWTAFDGLNKVTIENTDYPYHFNYLAANSAMRYVYSRDITADPAYIKLTTTVSSAINGPLYVRLRASGLNGKLELQTGTGWSDIKFIDINFD